MEYLHSHYAGNYGDVIKHMIHIAILNALSNKPVNYLETHSGAGIYDISDSKRAMLEKLLNYAKETRVPPLALNFLEYNKTSHNKPNIYLGSPLLASKILNLESCLLLTELSSSIHQQLKNKLKQDQRVTCILGNGYETIIDNFKSKQQNYLLIDPPFVEESDYELAFKTFEKASKQNPDSVIAVWYPLTTNSLHESFVENVKNINKETVKVYEYVDDESKLKGLKMFGCGMLINNLPADAQIHIEQSWKWIEQALKKPAS